MSVFRAGGLVGGTPAYNYLSLLLQQGIDNITDLFDERAVSRFPTANDRADILRIRSALPAILERIWNDRQELTRTDQGSYGRTSYLLSLLKSCRQRASTHETSSRRV